MIFCSVCTMGCITIKLTTIWENTFLNFFQASSRRNCWNKVFLSWRVVSNNGCLFYFHPGFAGENESIFGVCRVFIKGWWKNAFPWIFSESMKCSPTFGWFHHHESEEYSINRIWDTINKKHGNPPVFQNLFLNNISENIYRNEKTNMMTYNDLPLQTTNLAFFNDIIYQLLAFMYYSYS